MRIITTSILCIFVLSLNAQTKLLVDDVLKLSSAAIYKSVKSTHRNDFNIGKSGSNIIWDFKNVTGNLDTLSIQKINNTDTINWTNSTTPLPKRKFVLLNSNTEYRERIKLAGPTSDYRMAKIFDFPIVFQDSLYGAKRHLNFEDYSVVNGYGTVQLVDTTYKNCLRIKTNYKDGHFGYYRKNVSYYYACKGVGSYVVKIEHTTNYFDTPKVDSSFQSKIYVMNTGASAKLPNSPLNPNPNYSPLSINSDLTSISSNFKVFPNPSTNGILNLSFEKRNAGIIQIIDMTGKMVREVQFDNRKQFQINVSDLGKGIYIVQYIFEGNIEQKQLIIEN